MKNPLTPIRLAAERLRMKLMSKLDDTDGAMLERSTDTIVSQVEALRSLVDAFGDYAQEPQMERLSISRWSSVKSLRDLPAMVSPSTMARLT